jgi:PAS domain-containing protein
MSVYPNVEPQDHLGACLATCNTLGRVLDSVSDGIITIDRRMRIISFNRAAATITGFTDEEAVGKFFSKSLSTDFSIHCRLRRAGGSPPNDC